MHGAKDRGAKGAGRGVNSLERRPDALHQRHDAVSRRDRIGFRHGPYLGGSFLETADGKTRGAPAVGIDAKLPLELPLANRRHRPCTSVVRLLGTGCLEVFEGAPFLAVLDLENSLPSDHPSVQRLPATASFHSAGYTGCELPA